MSWLASIVVSLLTAAVGLMLGGYLASLAVGWYRVSSFEGASGYFVVAFALCLGLCVVSAGIALFTDGRRPVRAGREPGPAAAAPPGG